MAREKITEGMSVIIEWGMSRGKRGKVVNEQPAQLGNDLVEIELDGGSYILLERKHLRRIK